jgi:molybdopterin-containing oxidoreductase family iron-sulfur binding subunit
VIQPPEKIVPYVRPQEDILPGKPLFFATAMTLGGVATGLLGKSYDGRPIKIEGNPEHPGSLGATDVMAQASLLGMYDPDRSQQVVYRGTPKTWPNFMTAVRGAIDENRGYGGAGIRFLTETVTSPTLVDQFRRLAAELPGAKWYQYEPLNEDNAMAGARMAFGSPVNTVYKFDQADRVLTLDKDIFSGFNVRYKKDDDDLDRRQGRPPYIRKAEPDGRDSESGRGRLRRRRGDLHLHRKSSLDTGNGEGPYGPSRAVHRRRRR